MGTGPASSLGIIAGLNILQRDECLLHCCTAYLWCKLKVKLTNIKYIHNIKCNIKLQMYSYKRFPYTFHALLLQLLVVFTLCLYNPHSHFILLLPFSGPTAVLTVLLESQDTLSEFVIATLNKVESLL